jgi:hypothetical protein
MGKLFIGRDKLKLGKAMKEMMTNEVTINPVRAQYSILVLDKAIIVCFLIHQNIMTIATDTIFSQQY